MTSHRIGLISDVHGSPQALAEAMAVFEQKDVTQVLCAGDIAGYFDAVVETVDLLRDGGCDCVIGNHDVSYLSSTNQDKSVSDYLSSLPSYRRYDIAGNHIYLVHAEPPDLLHGGIKLLDKAGNYIETQLQQWQSRLLGFDADILIVGHTHQVYAVPLGDLLLINPGSLAFNHSCMILDLPEKTVRSYAVGGKEILPSWNFSLQFGR